LRRRDVRGTDWDEVIPLRPEGAGVLGGIGAMGVDEFNKKSAQRAKSITPNKAIPPTATFGSSPRGPD
jgi:hypothetical protein